MRQALFDAIVDELVSIEARQTIVGREPQETAAVPYDGVDDVVREAIGRRVALDRQAFGPGRRRLQREQQGHCREAGTSHAGLP